MTSSIHRICILAVCLILAWAAASPAAPEDAKLVAAYQAIFSDPNSDVEPGIAGSQDALLKPGEHAAKPASHEECFITCPTGTYACCNRTAHPHCSCVPDSIEVPCDIYGVPSCSNG